MQDAQWRKRYRPAFGTKFGLQGHIEKNKMLITSMIGMESQKLKDFLVQSTFWD